jgi:hypothetical protein
VTPAAVSALREAVPHHFALRFDRVDQLPGAIALLPQHVDDLERLTTALAGSAGLDAAPPRHRPYHLTVACSDNPDLAAEVRTILGPSLPLNFSCPELQVVEYDARNVAVVSTIPLTLHRAREG